jgi:CheY-like chemotaxis protein
VARKPDFPRNDGVFYNTDMKKILIVEDDVRLMEVYLERLKREGFTVFHSGSGAAALTLAQNEKPDLILLDIMIPGDMNGFDVLEQLKRMEATRAIPVIMLTNLDGEEKTARQVGAADYIVKANSSLNDVMEKIRSQIGGMHE